MHWMHWTHKKLSESLQETPQVLSIEIEFESKFRKVFESTEFAKFL